MQAPQTAEHVANFTLTVQQARLPLGDGETVNSFTINGTSPGPTLRVHQNDLVVVHMINKSPVSTSIHWHGIRVPNSADGVSGLTQDAVPPGHDYTYRFVAKDAGTYWYHSHQHSYDQTEQGFYGMFIVDPIKEASHDDVDATVDLHEWTFGDFRNFRYVQMVNGTAKQQQISATPGQWVRMRLVNTSSNPKLVTLAGAPYMIASIDGHDVNKPSLLTNTAIPLGTGQRYDIRFQMPSSGSVALFRATSTNKFVFEKTPAVVVGQQGASFASPAKGLPWFNLSSYGEPAPTTITPQSKFNASYTLTLNGHMGFENGRFGPMHTIDGEAFPNTPTIMVQEGQVIKLRFVNETDEYHPMHLHGHTFTVLSYNGHAISGSPIVLDTVLVLPHQTVEVAFLADNPGLWMIHCHNLFHAYMGMDMMIVYPNISTPFNVGNSSGNFPD
ncbi:copper oxidase [Ktedonobacter sp. SOSP1-52]|uniref:multicopper oxidase family protein n=1 Tax=Ktedonobacter sp. SOSP1-52 TaxID=2778366 RepID=UPI0019161B9A|nr:multicopper oxidase family protein [Ktedonobacter sp. SOSP1-52]GHO65458.1 copper oxidase [Ktedonobacter sp. SOSP1-52]